jgi:hypothetical protein
MRVLLSQETVAWQVRISLTAGLFCRCFAGMGEKSSPSGECRHERHWVLFEARRPIQLTAPSTGTSSAVVPRSNHLPASSAHAVPQKGWRSPKQRQKRSRRNQRDDRGGDVSKTARQLNIAKLAVPEDGGVQNRPLGPTAPKSPGRGSVMKHRSTRLFGQDTVGSIYLGSESLIHRR